MCRSLVFMVVSVFCAMLGSTLDTCRLVRCNVRVHSSSCGAHRDVVHSPLDCLYHRCHCICCDLVFVGRLPCCCRSVYVAMSCGGGFFTPDAAYDSVWDSVKPMTGKFFNYFPVPRVCWMCCMLNYWFSSIDDICPDNYNSSRFKLKDKCRSEKWEVYLYGDMTIKVMGICPDNYNYSRFR